jgi:L-Ala-D/L-Glu epimerase
VSSGTTIERLEAETLSLPLHTPFVTALRGATTAQSVVVRVTDSDGRVGLGGQVVLGRMGA